MVNKYQIFLFIFFLLFSCKETYGELDQIIMNENFQLRVPSSWNFERQALPGNMGFTINLWDEKEESTLSITVIDLDLSMEELMNFSKEVLDRNPVVTPINFSRPLQGLFSGFPTNEYFFTGRTRSNSLSPVHTHPHTSYEVNGKILIFKNGKKSFLINYQGKAKFERNALIEEILSTFTIKN
jgi:hypothetical protein